MAQKKISDLSLRSDFDATCNIPVEDATQTWRGTGAQIAAYIKSTYLTPTVQKFTATGSGTYTRPSPAPKYIRVRIVGGGGGGQGAGNAGGNDGLAGTDSYFRVGASPDILIANGGGATTGQLGGVGGGYTINSPAIGSGFNGGNGHGASAIADASVNVGGAPGASSPFGGAGAGGQGASSVGLPAKANTGSGGGGGGGTGAYNGAGGSAGGFVDAIIPTPSATYALFVGAGGTGGSAIGSGSAGGNGADGYIEVTEFYQ